LRRGLADVGAELQAVRVDTGMVPVADAVASYLFNSQLLSRPEGGMALVVPHECRETPTVARYLEQLVASGRSGQGAINELIEFDLRQSMRNGGGPACLRLRVTLTDEEAAAMHQGVIMTEDLYAKLVPWVERHYRDRVEPKDLADPLLARECAEALEELERILGLPGLYDLS
jgi:succinylarginine dihydrolase